MGFDISNLWPFGQEPPPPPPNLFMQTLSELGISVAAFRLLASILAGFPIAIVYRSVIRRSIYLTRNLYFLLVGVGLGFLNFGTDIFNCVFTAIVSFAIVALFSHSILNPILSWSFNLGYLLIGYYLTETEDYDILWTMPQCILCLRMISLSMDMYDSRPAAVAVRKRSTYLSRRPELYEVLAFAFFPTSFLIGPQYSMAQYLAFVNRETERHSHFFEYPRYAFNCLLQAILYLSLAEVGKYFIPNSYILSNGFASWPLVIRLIILGVWGRYNLYRYAGLWLLVESTCASMGLSYAGTSQGVTNWNAMSNVDMTVLNNAIVFTDYINSFNLSTNHWVMEYLYKRLRFLGNKYLSQACSLLFLSIWHGFHFGYILTFGFEFLVVAVERDCIDLLRNYPHFQQHVRESPNLQWLIYILQLFYATAFMGFALIPFIFRISDLYRIAYYNTAYLGFILFGGWLLWKRILIHFLNNYEKRLTPPSGTTEETDEQSDLPAHICQSSESLTTEFYRQLSLSEARIEKPSRETRHLTTLAAAKSYRQSQRSDLETYHVQPALITDESRQPAEPSSSDNLEESFSDTNHPSIKVSDVSHKFPTHLSRESLAEETTRSGESVWSTCRSGESTRPSTRTGESLWPNVGSDDSTQLSTRTGESVWSTYSSGESIRPTTKIGESSWPNVGSEEVIRPRKGSRESAWSTYSSGESIQPTTKSGESSRSTTRPGESAWPTTGSKKSTQLTTKSGESSRPSTAYETHLPASEVRHRHKVTKTRTSIPQPTAAFRRSPPKPYTQRPAERDYSPASSLYFTADEYFPLEHRRYCSWSEGLSRIPRPISRPSSRPTSRTESRPEPEEMPTVPAIRDSLLRIGAPLIPEPGPSTDDDEPDFSTIDSIRAYVLKHLNIDLDKSSSEETLGRKPSESSKPEDSTTETETVVNVTRRRRHHLGSPGRYDRRYWSQAYPSYIRDLYCPIPSDDSDTYREIRRRLRVRMYRKSLESYGSYEV